MITKIVRADESTLSQIKSCTYTQDVNGNTDVRVGCVSSASIEVSAFASETNAPANGERLTYYQVDDEGNETKIGVFYAEPTITTKNSYSFVAYDAVKKLDVDFSEHLATIQADFPMTLMEIVEEAANVANVTLASGISFPLSTLSINAFSQSGITCRQIFSWAAEIAGKFIRCNTDGEIIFDWYATASDVIAPSDTNGAIYYKQDGLTYEKYETSTLDRVRVYQTNIDVLAYVYPQGVTNGNTYDVSGNLLLLDASDSTYNTVAQNIYTVLSSLGTYRPCSVQLFPFNNPFKAGDKITITDSQGVTFNTIVMSMTINDSGATLTSTGNEEYANASSSLDSTILALTENAKTSAETNQYFWFQSSGMDAGAHITQIPKTDFQTNPQGGNTLIDSDSVVLRDGLTELAKFDRDKVQIGQDEKSRLEITLDSLSAYNDNNVKFFDIDYNGAYKPIVIKSIIYGGTTSDFIVRLQRIGINYPVQGLSGPNHLHNYTINFSQNWTTITQITQEFSDVDLKAISFVFGPVGPFSYSDEPPTNYSNISRFGFYEENRIFAIPTIPTITKDVTESFNSSSTFCKKLVRGTGQEIILKIRIKLVYNADNYTLNITIFGAYSTLDDSELGSVPLEYISASNAFNNIWDISTTAPSFYFGLNDSTQKGDFTATLGQNLIAESNNQTVIGKYNSNQPVNAFEIGNGTADSDRGNALTVDWSGILSVYNADNKLALNPLNDTIDYTYTDSTTQETFSDSVFVPDIVTKNNPILNGIVLTQSADNSGFHIHNTTWDATIGEEVPTNISALGSYTIYDVNNYPAFYMQLEKTNADLLQQSFILERDDGTGNNISHGFLLQIGANSNPLVVFPSTTSRDAWANGLNVVKKAGDTMTGTLFISNTSPLFVSYSNTIDLKEADNGVSALTWPGFRTQDKNGYTLSGFYSQVDPNGSISTGMWVYNRDTDGTQVASAGFRINADKSGNISYTMSRPENFCVALGVGTRLSAHLTASTTLAPSSAYTNLVRLTLPTGIWVVIAAVNMQQNGAAVGTYVSAALGSTNTGSQYARAQVGSSAGNTILQVSAILNFTASTTVYLNALQGSTVTRTINSGASYTYIVAVRIASR